MIKNPILRGFYPDPSICRAGEEFYMVTSSFSYFPGIPIFHSRDLANWEQIGHVLDRPGQLHVTYEDISLGIFAPTIRYHDGVYYMITTNMTTHENFLCTAADPAGKWSDPVVIRDAGGIDPSLFFDEDGKVYFTGTSPFGSPQYTHQTILCGELDLADGQIKGEQWSLWDGAFRNAISPEAPHLYKKDGWYYLMIAEGGTEFYHAVTISRSRSLKEPFESFHGNPILTHRHLGKNYPICNVGHADLVELSDGSCYMVCLASRLVNGYHKPLGRETFLVPVTWEEGWPVVNYGLGKLEWECPGPGLPEFLFEKKSGTDRKYVNSCREDFAGETLNQAWNFLGTPYEDYVQLKNGKLQMRMLKKTLVPTEFEGEVYDFFGHMMTTGKTKENMPFLGRRIQEFSYTAETKVAVNLIEKERAGIAILQNNANQIRLELLAGDDKKHVKARAAAVMYGLQNGRMHYEEKILNTVTIPKAEFYLLRVNCRDNNYELIAAADGTEYQAANGISGDFLGSETAGGFVGAYIGMFATSDGKVVEDEACFSYFHIEY